MPMNYSARMKSGQSEILDVALNDLAEIHGFAIRKEKSLVVCNRFTSPGKTPPTRNFITGALAAGCEFLKLKPLSRIARLNKAGTKWLYKLYGMVRWRLLANASFTRDRAHHVPIIGL
jgi:hypothetical protein